jgi:putative transcriptional regulator
VGVSITPTESISVQLAFAAMPIVLTLDAALAARRITARELSKAIGMTEQNLSLMRTGKCRRIRFETLARICQALDCQPAELLRFQVGTEPTALR